MHSLQRRALLHKVELGNKNKILKEMGQVTEKMKEEPEVKKKNQVEKLDIENTIVE